jgi:hypothetical protein
MRSHVPEPEKARHTAAAGFCDAQLSGHPDDSNKRSGMSALERTTSEWLDLEQAKNPDEETSVFTNRGNPEALTRKRKEMELTRVAFRVSRLMEF